MPYGHIVVSYLFREGNGFNPSYGLHALRALPPRLNMTILNRFQSLIWVACPTGAGVVVLSVGAVVFQSLIWVACPTGVAEWIKGGVET